jgi:hypothetical protein
MTTQAPYERKEDRSILGTMILLLAGPIVWAAHLGIVYFSQSMLCAHGLAGVRIAGFGLVPLTIVAASLLALAIVAAAAAFAGWARTASLDYWWTRADAGYERRVTLVLLLLSALGILWAGATAFVVPDCPMLR